MMRNNLTVRLGALLILLSLLLGLCACSLPEQPELPEPPAYAASTADVPEFEGKPYVIINNNVPFFTSEEITPESFESYSPLDGLGRCGVAFACVGTDLMPTDKRDFSLTSVTPSGWVNVSYDCVDGGYLYNRAHLIGWQLTAETTNKQNLITGTRFMNVKGMLPFENRVADHIKETENHVMYRVTPIYDGANLVARGVLMEAYSVEDNGDELSFCVYVYNNQPGVRINYADGTSKLDDGVPFPEDEVELPSGDPTYAYNVETLKFHLTTCRYATGDNVRLHYGTRDELVPIYTPCKVCNP